jgi:hypothetical protein
MCKQNAEEDKFARALFRMTLNPREHLEQKEDDDGWCGYPETLRQNPSYPGICHLVLQISYTIPSCVPVRDPIYPRPRKAETHGKKQSDRIRKHGGVKAVLVSILTTSALLLSMQCTGGVSRRHMNTSTRHDPSRSLDPHLSKVPSYVHCSRLPHAPDYEMWVILFIYLLSICI